MNLAIDPDLFHSAKDDNNSSQLLIKVEQHYSKFRIIRNKDILDKEYLYFFRKFRTDRRRKTAVSIVQRLLHTYSPEISTLIQNPVNLCTELAELASKKQCDSIECYLLRIATQLSRTKILPEMLLLMSGNKNSNAHRCSYDVENISTIRDHLPNLEIVTADQINDFEAVIKRPDIFNELHSKILELRCCLILSKAYNCTWNNNDINGEEIDLYCFRENENSRLILVGECKLRFGEIAKQPITREEIKQLTRKIDAAKAFERKRNDLSQDIEIKGLIISNAVELNPDARELVKEYQTSIHFVNVTMPKNWVNNPKWKINFANLHFDPPLDPPT